MKMIRKVNVKAKMTDNLRKEMIEDLQKVIENLNGDLKVLDDKMQMFVKELTKDNPGQAMIVRQQISIEKEKITKNQDRLKKEIADITKIPNGELVSQGTMETIAEINVGDNLTDFLSTGEVIVEDGKVLEIK